MLSSNLLHLISWVKNDKIMLSSDLQILKTLSPIFSLKKSQNIANLQENTLRAAYIKKS